jgi:hypothetical protein
MRATDLGNLAARTQAARTRASAAAADAHPQKEQPRPGVATGAAGLEGGQSAKWAHTMRHFPLWAAQGGALSSAADHVLGLPEQARAGMMDEFARPGRAPQQRYAFCSQYENRLFGTGRPAAELQGWQYRGYRLHVCSCGLYHLDPRTCHSFLNFTRRVEFMCTEVLV